NVTNVNTTNVTKNVSNTQVLMPASKLAAAKGTKMVPLDTTARPQARQQAQEIQQVAVQRTRAETPTPGGAPREPRTASLSVPKAQPVGSRPSASQPTTRPAGAGPPSTAARPTTSAPGVRQPGGTGTPPPSARPSAPASQAQPPRGNPLPKTQPA